MNAPRRPVLEHNLARLLARSYRPVRPTPEFRARLERRLAPWIAAPAARFPHRAIGWAAAGLAAAAALLLFARTRDPEGPTAPSSGLESILASGSGAIRVAGDEEPWFSLAPAGLAPDPGPGAGLAAGERVEVAAGALGGRWSVPGIAELALAADTRAEGGLAASAGPGAARALELELRRGGLGFALSDDASLALAAGGLELLLQPGARGEVDLRGAPSALGAAPGAVLPRLALGAGSALVRAPRGSASLDAPLEVWLLEGRLLDAEGRPLGGDTALSDAARTPLAEGELAAEPADDPDGAILIGRIVVAGEAAPPAELRVVLLRAVPLPAVSWPQSRTFALDPRARTFRWEGLEPGTYLVQVCAPESAPVSERGVVLVAGEERELAFSPAPGARSRGHVVDAHTGAPLEGALVVSESDAPVQILADSLAEIPDEVRAWTLTAADGSFVLEHLGPGTQRLRASHPERAPRWLEVPNLRGGEERGGVLFELGPGGGIEGRVENADGSAKVGAEIIASLMSGSQGQGLMTFGSAVVDGEGRYSIPRLAPGSYAVLDLGDSAAEGPEQIRPRFSFSSVREGQTERVDFLAPREGPIFTGRLLGEDGEPLARGNVELVPRSGDGRWAGQESMVLTSIAADGSFTFAGLSPGAYAVYASGGHAAVLRDLVEIGAGERVERTYRLGGATLAGRVVDAETGEPIERAVLVVRAAGPYPVGSVELGGAEVPTDGDLIAAKTWSGGDGRFRIEHLPAGRYELLAADEEGTRALALERDLELPRAAPLELRLPQGGVLELRVLDGQGAPLAGVAVELVDPNGTSMGTWIRPTTDAQGSARLRRLAPGRWSAVATRDGLRSAPVLVDVMPAATRSATLVLRSE